MGRNNYGMEPEDVLPVYLIRQRLYEEYACADILSRHRTELRYPVDREDGDLESVLVHETYCIQSDRLG